MHEILFDLSQMVNTWVITRGIMLKRTNIEFEVSCLTSNDAKPFCRWISTTCCIYSFEPFSYFSFTQKNSHKNASGSLTVCLQICPLKHYFPPLWSTPDHYPVKLLCFHPENGENSVTKLYKLCPKGTEKILKIKRHVMYFDEQYFT